MAKDIPYCPLMSAGSDIDKVCTLDGCACFSKLQFSSRFLS